jgi:hypothetical protein
MKNGLSKPFTTAAMRMSFNFFGVAAVAEVPDTTRVAIETATSPTSALRFRFISLPKSVTYLV